MTQQEVTELFAYEPATGMLRRRDPKRTPYPWRGAGRDRRYLITTLQGEHHYLHRLVWLYHHGWLPERIDHIDRNTRNNRIENLRPCTSAQNQYNSARKRNNRSGAKGVVFHPACKSRPWQAKIVVNGKVHSLGYYATVEAASNAYAAGAALHAKEFARKD